MDNMDSSEKTSQSLAVHDACPTGKLSASFEAAGHCHGAMGTDAFCPATGCPRFQRASRAERKGVLGRRSWWTPPGASWM